MACFHPLQAWRGKGLSKNGKRNIVFKRSEGLPTSEMRLPCGQCIGCRLERSRQWAIRCVHESELYDENCFITLTYSDEFLPKDKSLVLRHFQLFMKRLRKKFSDRRIRFFHCGEYGDENSRPHYHAVLFGFDFHDKEFYKHKDSGDLWKSPTLESIWTYGMHTIGDVSFDTCAYVARYIMKKITGDGAETYYKGCKPEYITMSRRPGIGSGWFDSFSKDCYPSDSVIVNGKEVQPPKFYDDMYDKINHDAMEQIKADRLRYMTPYDRSVHEFMRLPAKELNTKCRMKQFTRNLSD